MENILFENEKKSMQAEVIRMSQNLIRIVGKLKVNTNGFVLLTCDGESYGEFNDYTTLYQEMVDGFILSNNGSVFVEPKPEPDPDPGHYEPTLEEVKEAKVGEMNLKQQEVIASGVDVKLVNGSIEHFTLTQYDQQSLMGLQAQVMAGIENIPWHNADEAEHCKFYSNADMNLITTAAMAHVTYHVTRFRDLRIYIRSLPDKDIVQSITYDIEIPNEWKSDVIKAMEMEVSLK